MTLFEIADVLWRRGEFEAYNALVKHAREYTTLVECGLTLLSRDIARTATATEPHRAEMPRLRVRHALDIAFEEDSPLLNMESWQEAERRVAALPGLSDRERGVRVWSTYTYITEGGDEEAELQLDDDRWAEAYMRAAELVSPNAHEFKATEERIYEQLCKEDWRAA